MKFQRKCVYEYTEYGLRKLYFAYLFSSYYIIITLHSLKNSFVILFFRQNFGKTNENTPHVS